MKMNRSIRKLVAGSLVCAMAAGATPFTNVNPYAFTKVQAASEVLEEEELYLQKEISGNIWWGWEGSMWVYKDYGTKVKVVSTSEEIGKISCTFESSDPSVFKVDKDGVITPVSMGVAQLIVHAKTENGKKQTKVQNVRIVDHFECGGMAYAPIGENEIKFLSALYEGKKDQGRICIPHMINADVMKVVGAESCAGFKNVKFIEVPDSVTTIEDRAFADNDSLEFVMIPKSVTKIADNAFDRENISDDKIIIKGYKGTEAEKFAKTHEDIVTFEAIEGEYVPYKLLYSIKFEGCNGYKTLEVGEEYQFIVKADPIDTDEEITFTSEDESIVSVTSAGAVTAKKPGYTKIIATSTTGIENAVYVNVNAPLETTEPTATPVITTTPTVTPTVKVTSTPVVTPTAKVTTAPAVTATAKVTATPVVTPTAKVTTAPAVTVTPVVTPTAKVTTAPAITPTAKVTTTPVVTPTAEVTATPGLDLATPTSSVTPVATPDETASADVSESDSTTDTAVSEEETPADIVDVINSILETPLTDDKKVVSQTSNKTTTKAKKASLSILTSKNKKFVAGKKYTLKAQKKNTGKKLKWSVSNKKIATINENTGVLKAKKAGKVTITVTCGDLKKKITIKIQ